MISPLAKLESSNRKKNKKEVEIRKSMRQADFMQSSVDVRVDTVKAFCT